MQNAPAHHFPNLESHTQSKPKPNLSRRPPQGPRLVRLGNKPDATY